MRRIRLLSWAAFCAALLFATAPAAAGPAGDCPPGDPGCLPAPPGSVQVNPNPVSADGQPGSVEAPGVLAPIEAAVPMLAPRVEVEPLTGSLAPAFASLSVPVRYQDPSDVSCGVQALGMALDALPGAPPTSAALLGFLQGNNMMYDFGTGVEELAFAAQTFGYRGSDAFHGASLADLAGQLAAGSPVVVPLGANGEGQPGHFVTVTGISADGQWISYNDPTLGKVVVSAEEFLRLWGLQGNSGVSVAVAPPHSAPDPYPWVALSAAIMALVSTTPFGRQRVGVGGRITSGGGAAPRAASRPAPAPPRPAPRPAPAPARPAPAPPRPAPAPAPAPRARFDAEPPPPARPVTPPAPRPPTTPPQPAPSLFSRITSTVSSAVSSMATTVRSAASTVSSAVSNVISSATTAARNTVSTVATTLRNTASSVSTAVTRAASAASSAVRNTVASVTSAVSRAASAVGQAAATVGNSIRTAVTSAVSTTRTAAQRAAQTVGQAARNVAASALTAARDAVAAATPVAQRIVAAPFIAAHDFFRAGTPVAQGIVDWLGNTIQAGIDGWTQAAEGFGVLVGYTWDAVLEGRWEDASRALGAWRRLPGALVSGVIDAYSDAPFVAQAGLSMAPGGDFLDLASQGRNLLTGQQVDWLVVGLSAFGLASDAGWVNLFAPDPVDGANAALALAKALLRQLPAGPAREALEQMLKNPADYGRLVSTLQAIWSNRKALRALDESPEVAVWLLRRGPEAVDVLARYGDEAVALVSTHGETMLRYLGRTADTAGDLAERTSRALQAAARLRGIGAGSPQAAALIDEILDASSHSLGNSDRVVIGQWFDSADDGFGYLQEVADRGGRYFETPPGTYAALGNNRALMEEVNQEFLRRQLEAGVGRFDLAGETIGDVLSGPRPGSFTTMELRFLAEEAPAYGYIFQGNSWVLSP